MEGKVLWNWNLRDQELIAKESETSYTEEIAQLTIMLISKLSLLPQKVVPIELWEPREWPRNLAHACFTDDSPRTDETKTNRNVSLQIMEQNSQY